MDFAYIWHDDGYWCKVQLNNFPIPVGHLGVKVTDLETKPDFFLILSYLEIYKKIA